MFPANSTDPDPYNLPPISEPPSFSASAISAQNASLYLHQIHDHHHPHPQHHSHHQQQQEMQQQSFTDLQQWPHVAYYAAPPDMVAHSGQRLMNEGLLGHHDYMQQAEITGNETAQRFMQQPGNAMQAMQLQGLARMPAVEQFYNEQIYSNKGAGSQVSGIEPGSIYDNVHPSSVLNRRLQRSGPSEPRYEETACTPRPRWCPTQEQIQILESLFSTGTTTPSRDIIVYIAAQLRKYGTIAEANVFYWFQNRKARAKRKLQPPPPPPRLAPPSSP